MRVRFSHEKFAKSHRKEQEMNKQHEDIAFLHGLLLALVLFAFIGLISENNVLTYITVSGSILANLVALVWNIAKASIIKDLKK
jgi:uncharacterized membrane protein (DUF485 family)